MILCSQLASSPSHSERETDTNYESSSRHIRSALHFVSDARYWALTKSKDQDIEGKFVRHDKLHRTPSSLVIAASKTRSTRVVGYLDHMLLTSRTRPSNRRCLTVFPKRHGTRDKEKTAPLLYIIALRPRCCPYSYPGATSLLTLSSVSSIITSGSLRSSRRLLTELLPPLW